MRRYLQNGEELRVEFPEEKILVFDVETLVCEGNFAVLAVALSPTHWFVSKFSLLSLIFEHISFTGIRGVVRV